MHYLKVSKFRKVSVSLRLHVCYCGESDGRLYETTVVNDSGLLTVSRVQCFTHTGFVRFYLLRKYVYSKGFN